MYLYPGVVALKTEAEGLLVKSLAWSTQEGLCQKLRDESVAQWMLLAWGGLSKILLTQVHTSKIKLIYYFF